MKTRHVGLGAVAALCALVSACGGGGDSPPPPPTPPATLPESVAITADAQVEAGADEQFKTSLDGVAGVSFHWDFGDGSTGEGPAPRHAYAKAGSYEVTLAVANTDEDLRIATWTVQVGNYANVKSLDCTNGDSAGWCWQNAGASGHQVNDLFFVDAKTAWAVGEAGTILKSTDGGDSWTRVPAQSASLTSSLTQVRFRDAANGLVVTNEGSLLMTADGGATWTRNDVGGQLSIGSSPSVVAFDAARIVLSNGQLLTTSHDAGQTWKSGQMYAWGQAVQTNGADCWVANGNVAVARGCEGDASFVPMPQLPGYDSQNIGALSFGTPQQGLAMGYGYGYNGSFYAYAPLAWSTADGGGSWSAFVPTGFDTMQSEGYALQMTSALDGWATNASLHAAVTHDGGRSWANVAPPAFLQLPGYLNQASGLLGAGRGLWESRGSRLAVTLDEGAHWSEIFVSPEDPQQQVASNTPMRLVQYTDASNLVVAAQGRYYVTHDGGQGWTRVLGADARDVGMASSAAWFFDAKNGIVLGSNGRLATTADGGRTWARTDYGVQSQGPVALHFVSATEGWLLLDGQLSRTTDAGKSWSSPLALQSMQGLQGMTWGDATHAWAYSGTTLFATADAGATWTPVALPAGAYQDVRSAVMTGPNAGVIATSFTTLTTADGGVTWKSQNAGSYWPKLVRGAGHTVWSVSQGLRRSDDDGVTWRNVDLANSPIILDVAFADALHGWAVGPGTVLYTIDGGDTWSRQPVGNDVRIGSVTAIDARTAWLTTLDGQVLATATAGF
jgi:photosystem II stability/assembly factor-like uncharacterized protein